MKFAVPDRKPDPDPADFTVAALYCAIAACKDSLKLADQDFADACRRELQSRLHPAQEFARQKGVTR